MRTCCYSIAVVLALSLGRTAGAVAQMPNLPTLSSVMGESKDTSKKPEADPTDTTPVEKAPEVAAKRAENQELLRVAQRRLDAGDPTNPAAAQEVATYKTVEAVLAQQEAVDRQIKDLTARQSELQTQIRSTRAAGAEGSEPTSFIDLDRLKDELAAEDARVNLAEDQLGTAKGALDKARAALTKLDVKRRQAQDALEAGKSAPNAAELSTAFEQARQAANLAGEIVTLREKEVKRGEVSQAVQQLAAQLKKERCFAPLPKPFSPRPTCRPNSHKSTNRKKLRIPL